MNIELKDGTKLEIKEGQSGYDVALSLSVSLAKKALAYQLDEKIFDLHAPIEHPGTLTILTSDDANMLEVLRHSASHLLAQALLNLYPGSLLGFGPAIEEGFYYDIDFGDHILSDADFEKIEREMQRLSRENLPINRRVVSKQEAKKLFKDNPYKLELIKEIDTPISIYEQGNFFDLCAGPHLPSTGYIKHFKLMSIAGAYWRGKSTNKMLTRIYGTAFFNEKDLTNHLALIEEAKRRDHRKLGRELGLFMISEYGPGMPFWLPNGMTLRRLLEEYWYELHEQAGYEFIKTPIMLSKELWEISGHWANYRDNMYTTSVDEQDFAIKPMNCPGGILVYKSELHSYKDLPIRTGELGLVHRYEASGALNGLFRVRSFTQDDAHIFLRKDQLLCEIQALLKLFHRIYELFGLDYHIELSTRPEEKFIGEIEVWDLAEKLLAQACEESGQPYKLNPGDGAFYGPKLDFKLRDSLGRIWQCGTIQLDMNLPERFDISYIDEHNEKVRPIMLHRAIYGSIERFIGILIEHFAGAFPTWLAPIQVKILPVKPSVHQKYVDEVKDLLQQHRIRITIDDSEEKLGYRLRKGVMEKVPYLLVIGDQEMENGTLTYRRFASQAQITVTKEDFLNLIKQEIASKSLPQSLKSQS